MADLIHKYEPASWEENVNAFFTLCNGIKREGMDKLLNYIVLHTDFLKAPASTRFHACYEGGLLYHSINVYNRLLWLMTNEPKMQEKIGTFTVEEANEFFESIAIVALFHDLCKSNTYVREKKSRKTGRLLDNGKPEWEDYMGYTYSPELPFGHAEKSILILERYIKLSREEITAILYHMCDYNHGDTSFAYNESPLAVNLHVADFQASYIDESCKPAFTYQNERDPETLALYSAFRKQNSDGAEQDAL